MRPRWEELKENTAEFISEHRRGLMILLMLVVGYYALCFSYDFAVATAKKVVLNRHLNRIVEQVVSLVDNTRVLYQRKGFDKHKIVRQLIDLRVAPESMIEGKTLKNAHGGEVLILDSSPMFFAGFATPIPTFKVVFQGLPHDVCVGLALIDWGKKENGLVAEAIGHTDISGIDTASRDVEEKYEQRIVQVIDNEGRRRSVEQRPHALSTIAKPGDDFFAIPFPQHLAESGCACRSNDSCSFALKYLVYAIK